MALNTLSLNKIVASSKAILFETNEGIFVGHNDPTDVMNPNASIYPEYNKWNFNILDGTNTMIGNIYPLSAFTVNSYQYQKSPLNRQNNIDDFLKVFGPDTLFLKGCQYFEYAYLLSDLTNKSISTDLLYFNNDMNVTSYIERGEMPVDTYVYPSSSIINADTTSGINTYVPLYNLSGIQYNFVEEFPLEFKYYGYEKANTTSAYYYTFGDSFNTKNQYSYNYGVDSRVISTTDNDNVSAYLTNARTYSDIGFTGDILYMVYKTNKYYNSDSIPLTATNVTFGMTPTSSFASSGDIANIPMSYSSTLTSNVINKYDNVEVLHSINRIVNNIGHKSNLFSINIQNSNIDSSSLSATDKEYIKKSLTNIIENSIKTIIPANTQLFKIYWNGQ